MNLNSPSLLEAGLDEAIKQSKLGEKDRKRIVVGRERGLGYRCFDIASGFDLETIRSQHDAKRVEGFLNRIQDYLLAIDGGVKRYGFNTLKIQGEDLSVSTGFLDYTSMAIGDVTIESSERFIRFLEMIKDPDMAESHERLMNDYRFVWPRPVV